MRHLGRLFFLCFLLLSLALACTTSDPTSTPALSLPPRSPEEPTAPAVLVVGTAITAPFEYREPGTNRLIGFDVDLMNLLADRLQVQIEWREMAFADLLDELAAGSVDVVIAAMYITAAREEIVDFTMPYLDSGLVMVVRSEETEISTFADLAGKQVGVKENATGDRWAQQLQAEQQIDLILRRYTETQDSLEDLAAGHLDAVFNDKLNTLVYLQTQPGLRIQGDVFAPASMGIAVRSGNTALLQQLNAALQELKAAGTVEILYNRWISSDLYEP